MKTTEFTDAPQQIVQASSDATPTPVAYVCLLSVLVMSLVTGVALGFAIAEQQSVRHDAEVEKKLAELSGTNSVLATQNAVMRRTFGQKVPRKNQTYFPLGQYPELLRTFGDRVPTNPNPRPLLPPGMRRPALL